MIRAKPNKAVKVCGQEVMDILEIKHTLKGKQFTEPVDDTDVKCPLKSVLPSIQPDTIECNSLAWTPEEQRLFLEALRTFGKDWKAVQDHIKTRTRAQIHSHSQKLRNQAKNNPSRMEALLGQDVFDILEGPLVTGKP
jgi:SHAQKYF class myb-like DNA-binding protein